MFKRLCLYAATCICRRRLYADSQTITFKALYPPNIWEKYIDDVFSILKPTHLENFFHHINNLHQNIKFTMEKISNEEQAFLETLLKRNNGKVSILV